MYDASSGALVRRHFSLQAAWLILLLACCVAAWTQQVSDTNFRRKVARADYPEGTGPLVAIDEAHQNFHTIDGRYQSFAAVLRLGGYRVQAFQQPLGADALREIDLLVIANPLAKENVGNWSLPTPSAFTSEEAGALSQWIRDGGSLLLIADHMPFPGAVSEISRAFDIEFRNGFTYLGPPAEQTGIFERKSGMLRDHLITRGSEDADRIDHVQTFMGSAFRGEGLQGLLVLPPGSKSKEPKVAWQFPGGTLETDVSGWFQGAVKNWGKGRVAVFGEAAMFSAQLAGPQQAPFGMNLPSADQNAQFLLNVVRWLTRDSP